MDFDCIHETPAVFLPVEIYLLLWGSAGLVVYLRQASRNAFPCGKK